MSGILRMNEWEDSLAAGREHVEKQAPEEVKLARLLNQEMERDLHPNSGDSNPHVNPLSGEKNWGCKHPISCKWEYRGRTFCTACGEEVVLFSRTAGNERG